MAEIARAEAYIKNKCTTFLLEVEIIFFTAVQG